MKLWSCVLSFLMLSCGMLDGSLDDGENFIYLSSLDALKLLDRNYTGALLGMFATSNGKKTKDYADFDWVRYKDYIR